MLVNRLDGFWGVDREGVPASPGGTPENRRKRYRDWLCRHARGPRAIQAATTTDGQVHYALDLGNTADSGQFIPGGPSNEVNRPSRTCLRTVAELYPAIVDPQLDDDDQPSCSALDSISRQEPFVNQSLAQHALALLARLFRYGTISYHGGFVSLVSGTCAPLRIEPKTWKRIQDRQKVEAARRRVAVPSRMRPPAGFIITPGGGLTSDRLPAALIFP